MNIIPKKVDKDARIFQNGGLRMGFYVNSSGTQSLKEIAILLVEVFCKLYHLNGVNLKNQVSGEP